MFAIPQLIMLPTMSTVVLTNLNGIFRCKALVVRLAENVRAPLFKRVHILSTKINKENRIVMVGSDERDNTVLLLLDIEHGTFLLEDYHIVRSSVKVYTPSYESSGISPT